MTELSREQTPVFTRGYRLQWEPSQNMHVILYPEGMVRLNDSASMILQLVDGKSSLAHIISTLQARFPEASGLDQDVLQFFQHAIQHQWVSLT